MRCGKCGKDFNAGLAQCPYCHAPVHYGGNTTFYDQAARNELSIKDFFVNVFGTQPAGSGDKMFASGTVLTTPTPDRMLQEWNKPWLYARVLLIGLLFNFLCYFMFNQQGHPGGMYMLFSFGCLVIPLSVLIFYWEINIPRDIPLYKVFMIFFVGGVLSLIFAILLPNAGEPAYLAPLTEEPAKILALAIFIYWLDCRYIFGGLLIGAAVGAGFSAFEDVFYVMNNSVNILVSSLIDFMSRLAYIQPGDTANLNNFVEELKVLVKNLPGIMYERGSDVLILRSSLTLNGHVTWAAIEGGALVMAKGNDNFKLNHLVDPRFLGYLGAAMALHFCRNYGFELHPLPYVSDASYLVLNLLAIFVVFTLIQRAVTQVLSVVNSAGSTSIPAQSTFMLQATSGPLMNALFPLEQRITLGRDPAVCNVVFPAGTPGVSRRHCVLEPHSDGVYLMDLASTSGTFLQNGQRLPVNQWTKISGNFYLGSPNVMFAVNAANATPLPNPTPTPLPPPAPIQTAVSIVGIAGALQGQNFSDAQRLTIGREPSQCNVVLPPRTPGVSRRHCILERRANGVFIMDVGSMAGTFLENGQQLPQNQWVPIAGRFYLGSPDVMFAVN